MVESDLPFNRHTAHKLMQIAGDKRLTNVSHGKLLPPSWTSFYELTKLDDDTFDQKLRDGTIHAGMQRKDVVRKNVSRERGLHWIREHGQCRLFRSATPSSKRSDAARSKMPSMQSSRVTHRHGG
jgi:hypothetical protein